ncbi:MAG: class I SAM-dependent methyltransferase [Ignavibacteriae bacterium]|nr:MAG: class I SAM-dependent methyltransferase [Ignavibacteriota bacterium]
MNLKYLKHLSKSGTDFIHPKGLTATKLLIDKLDIQAGQKILEIGCGTGGTLAEIANKYDVSIDGVDVLEDMIKTAQERINYLNISNKVKLHKAGINDRVPFTDNYFDKAYSESVIGFQDINNFNFMLHEIYRILKKDGVFIANEALWKENVNDDVIRKYSVISEKYFGLSHASSSNLNLSYFIETAKSAGFEICETIDLSKIKFDERRFVKNRKSQEFTDQKKSSAAKSIKYFIDEYKYKLKQKMVSKYGRFIDSYLIILKK